MTRAGITVRTLIALVALCAFAFPASAPAASVVGETTKGGSCRWETIAVRAGTSLTYGGRVENCSSKFGIRTVEGRGLLYDEPPNLGVILGATQAGPGSVPYQRTGTYDEAEEGMLYRSVWGAAVVLKTRKSARRPKKPERWIDPDRGRRCRVYTTFHSSDTLGCTIHQDF